MVTHFGLFIFICVIVSNDYFLISYPRSTEIASKSIRGIHLYFVSLLRWLNKKLHWGTTHVSSKLKIIVRTCLINHQKIISYINAPFQFFGLLNTILTKIKKKRNGCSYLIYVILSKVISGKGAYYYKNGVHFIIIRNIHYILESLC